MTPREKAGLAAAGFALLALGVVYAAGGEMPTGDSLLGLKGLVVGRQVRALDKW